MGYLGVYVRMYINRGGDKNMEKRVGVSMNNYDDVEIRMEEYIDIYSTTNVTYAWNDDKQG